ncbi:DEAD/DEAH box helicase [Cetobacterium sp. SF1]|uniref:DEAD/DEAH box helicase n=1 Tax=Cetobacterium sp. SF1 TaxID=3417654 RepID=UPI003CE99E52
MINDIMNSLKTSLIDNNFESNEDLQHKLLSNESEKILSVIREELNLCDEFIISVAFITEGGVVSILEELKKLAKKNIKGKILTGDYLNFTEPKALKRLLEFPNIELKILSNEDFHAKGYFFRRGSLWNIIIGSSNLTQKALTTNFEWNLKISSSENGKILKDTVDNFKKLFEKIPLLTIEKLEEYDKNYKLFKKYFKNEKVEKYIEKEGEIIPNSMQEKALESISSLRAEENKALIISATGTGKTFLSAFDVRKVNPKKMLFIAHRKNILEKAKLTFEILIKDKKMEIYKEDINLEEVDYVFAMIQTLGKDRHLEKIPKDYFDYIIIDEVHHSGAKTYQNLIEYFTPKFLLGMTATPERTDNFDIYKLFDYNIAYEIRLYDALRENLLCPFHYFGITDILVDGKYIDEKSTINNLVSEERVSHILEKSKFYGSCGEKIHGLIFVSKIEEAKKLEIKFLERGILSRALTGETSDEEREKAIKELEQGKIEYIISVDIFNEGIDIPCVNQVILLRPTESAIVYIQQLGRGLRKFKNKEFVVILDFIGNYEKNFLIPTAISQNNSFHKDFMKSFILNGTNLIPGESTIVFDEISKEKIFESIGETNFSTRKNIEHDFNLLEKQLGRIPYLYDFFNRNMIDPSVILKFKKDYDDILKILRPKINHGTLSEIEKNYLKFLSSIFTPGKRIHEMILLRESLKKEQIFVEEIEKILEKDYLLFNQRDNIENALKHLAKEIFTSLSTIKEFNKIFEREKENYYISKEFFKFYKENNYFKILIDDLIKYNLAYVEKNYKQSSQKTIELHKEYTKQEAFWNLNLDYNNGYQVSGYTVFEEIKKVIIFVTSAVTSYDNKFESRNIFSWFSKNQRSLKRNGKLTSEGKIAENYYEIEVFIKKENGENFYYMGQVEKVLSGEEIFNEEGKTLVEYKLKLKNSIKKDLFDYLIHDTN